MIRPEPHVEAEIYWAKKDKEHEIWLSHRPICMVCEENIARDKCYIVYDDEPDETCICEDCMKGQIEHLRRARLNQGLEDALEDFISTLWGNTPEGRGW